MKRGKRDTTRETNMTDFTTLLNRGHKMYVERHIKKKKCGRCNGCENYALLIHYTDPKDKEYVWDLCNGCYEKLIFEAEK